MLSLESRKKLAIGTAQFGYKYGVTNKRGKTSAKEISKIISLQRKYKINYLDTAQAYKSEKILKNFDLKKFDIIMKLQTFNGSKNLEKSIKKNILKAMKNLKVNSIFCLMVHESRDLLKKDGVNLYRILKALKDDNYVEKIGFSTYGTSNILKILKKFKFDVVQTTFNPFDRRILNQKIKNKLKKKGVEVHVRSIFLQGLLLLLQTNKIPKKLKKFENNFKKWNNFVKNSGLKPFDICINYALSQNFDKIIFGINDHKQLKEIINCRNKKIMIPKNISTNNKFLINPYYWS